MLTLTQKLIESYLKNGVSNEWIAEKLKIPIQHVDLLSKQFVWKHPK